MKVTNITDKGLGLSIPPYRVDVQREIDVIEEVLRVYGFNNIQTGSKLKASMANSSRTEDHKVQNIIANQLVSQGFYEIMANSLTTPAYTELSEDFNKNQQVQILNPLSFDLSVMRQTLLFGGLEALAYNINRKKSDLKFFEFGNSYAKVFSEYEEQKRLSMFATGNVTAANWNLESKPVDFFLFKGYIDALFQRLGINKLTTEPTSSDIFSEGITYVLGDKKLVSFGSLRKVILKHFDIKQEVFYADFNWNAILKVISSKIKFVEIPKNPIVKRDLALQINEDVSFATIHEIVKTVDKSLILDVSLFDVYQGDKLPEGTKSYAISVKLQDKDKTLTDVQIEKIMSKIHKQLQDSVGAKLR